MKTKLVTFLDRLDLEMLRCPLCHEKVTLNNNAVQCINKHNFNLNKKGFVNLEPQKHLKHYDKTLFEARHNIINDGYFDELIAVIKDILQKYNLDNESILDVGCGEGSFLEKLNINNNYGIDLSLDAIQVASKYYTNNCFIVADLANIPFANNSIKTVLNILTPANYVEFKRVLKADGYLIKVIPNKDYLKELKSLLGVNIKKVDDVYKKTESNSSIIETIELDYKIEVNNNLQKDFICMTPLMMNVKEEDKKNIIDNFPKEITISLKIIIAQL